MSNYIKVRLNGEKRQHKSLIFSGGEVHVNVANMPESCSEIKVTCKLVNSDTIMEMLLLHDALSAKYPMTKKHFFIPYMPYARQDRRCAKGDPFSFVTFVKSILVPMNDEYTTFSCVDVHSQAAVGILKNFLKDSITCISASSAVGSFKDIPSLAAESVVVFPDAGAQHKSEKFTGTFESKGVAYGSKIRCPHTGSLSGFDIDVQDFEGQDVLIVDDICDGGGTFLGLASVLKERNCGNIHLYVTHGIFSKGLSIFEDMFTSVYCTDSVYPFGDTSGYSTPKFTFKVLKL